MLALCAPKANMALEPRNVSRTTQIAISRVSLDNGNCRQEFLSSRNTELKNRYLRIIKIDVVRCSKSNSTTMKHVYNKQISLKAIPFIFISMGHLISLPVTVMVGMVSHILIKPATMESLMPFPINIHTVMLNYVAPTPINPTYMWPWTWPCYGVRVSPSGRVSRINIGHALL